MNRIPTPWPTLDASVALRPGSLVAVEGDGMSGRSLFVLHLAGHAAIEHGIGSLHVTFEARQDDEYARLLAALGSIGVDKFHRHDFAEDELAHLLQAAEPLRKAPLVIRAPHRMSVEDLRASISRCPTQPIRLVTIDRIDYMAIGARNVPDSMDDIARLTAGLKELAGELDACVVVTSQLPTPPYMRDADGVRPNPLHAGVDTLLRLKRAESEITVTVQKGVTPRPWPVVLELQERHVRLVEVPRRSVARLASRTGDESGNAASVARLIADLGSRRLRQAADDDGPQD